MSDINIIDIEASGLHFDSYPIEVAILVNGVVHSWLIKPEPKWQYWCKTAEGIHGISREKLDREGVSVVTVASELSALLEVTDGLLYSDAANWDGDWIKTLFDAANMPMPFHVISLFDLMDESQKDDFWLIRKQLAESGRYHEHRAGEDVRLIEEAYIQVVE